MGLTTKLRERTGLRFLAPIAMTGGVLHLCGSTTAQERGGVEDPCARAFDVLDAALARGDRGAAEAVFAKCDLANWKGAYGETALHVEVVRSNDLLIDPEKGPVVPALGFLIDSGVGIEARDRDGNTPLHWAAAGNKLEATRVLLARGAPPDLPNASGLTPLLVAVRSGGEEVVEVLVEHGATTEARTPEGETALMTAARLGNRRMTKALLAKGASADAANSEGRTVAEIAERWGHPELAGIVRGFKDSERLAPSPAIGVPGSWTVETAIAAMRGLDMNALDQEQLRATSDRLDSAWAFLRGSGKPGLEALQRAVREEWEAETVDSFFLLDATAVLTSMLENEKEAARFARRALERADPGVSTQNAFNLAFGLAVMRKEADAPILARLLSLPEDAHAYLFMHHMNLDWRKQLIFVFGAFGRKIMTEVRKELGSADPRRRRSAAFLSGIHFDEPSVDGLRRLLEDSVPGVRLAAAQALGYVGNSEDVPRLGRLLVEDPVEEVRFQAAFGLYELGTRSAVPPIVRGLGDPSDRVRGECVAALFMYRDQAALQALAVHLPREPHADGKAWILRTLSEIGTVAEAEAIERAMSQGDRDADPLVKEALRAIRLRGATAYEPGPADDPSVTFSKSEWDALDQRRSDALLRLSDEGFSDWAEMTEEMNRLRVQKRIKAPGPSAR